MIDFSKLTPAHLTLDDLLGARVKYYYARPFGQSPMVEVGTISDYHTSKNGTFQMLIQPDNRRLMSKWKTDDDFIEYVRDLQPLAEMKATA